MERTKAEKNSVQSGVGIFFKKLILEYNTILMLIVLMVASTVIHDKFLTPNNIMNILQQQTSGIILAMGMLFVILTGGIDLSVGSIEAVGAVMVATCITTLNLSTGVSIVISLAIGAGLGLFTGLLVAYLKMAPFIASLAMMTIGRGVARIIAKGSPIQTPPGTLDEISAARIGPFPVIIIIALIVIVLFFIMHKYTGYGRIVTAIGSNSSAVRLAGIQVNRYLVSVYALSGLCAALAGIIVAIRTFSGNPTAGGQGEEMNAIAAVVIGGGSLSGGRGFVIRTVIGVIILGLISNIMNLVGVPPYPQEVIKGFIIIGAVILQGATTKKA